MTRGHFRHLPVSGDSGLAGITGSAEGACAAMSSGRVAGLLW